MKLSSEKQCNYCPEIIIRNMSRAKGPWICQDCKVKREKERGRIKIGYYDRHPEVERVFNDMK